MAKNGKPAEAAAPTRTVTYDNPHAGAPGSNPIVYMADITYPDGDRFVEFRTRYPSRFSTRAGFPNPYLMDTPSDTAAARPLVIPTIEERADEGRMGRYGLRPKTTVGDTTTAGTVAVAPAPTIAK